MKSTLIICPHIDDDLYGCAGYIINSKSPITVAYCTNSDEQKHRLEVITPLYNEVNPNINIEFAELWKDGDGRNAFNNSLYNGIQKKFDDWFNTYETIFINSDAIHQDHHALHGLADVAQRPRPNIKCNMLLEYDYLYNNKITDRNGCITVYYEKEIYEKLLYVCDKFDEKCNVVKSSHHITNFRNAFKLGEFIGSVKEHTYAEKFPIQYIDMFSEGI